VRQQQGPSSIAHQPLQSGLVRFRSQAFEEIHNHFYKCAHPNILELGMPLGMNVDYFSQYSCRLFIEDLYSRISVLSSINLPRQLESLEYQQLGDDFAFDLILCWDLLDYLRPAQILGVVDLFRPYVKRGSLLYILTSDTRMISDQPQTYRLADDMHIEPELLTLEQRENPRHRPGNLQDMLGSFMLQRSYMLTSGRMEHLFKAV